MSDFHCDRRVDVVDIKVATLEERSVSQTQTLARIEKTVDELAKATLQWQKDHSMEQKEWQDKITETLASIKTDVSIRISFVGGIIFVITAIWSAIVAFKDSIFGK